GSADPPDGRRRSRARACPVAGSGAYRRWGIPPRPEDVWFCWLPARPAPGFYHPARPAPPQQRDAASWVLSPGPDAAAGGGPRPPSPTRPAADAGAGPWPRSPALRTAGARYRPGPAAPGTAAARRPGRRAAVPRTGPGRPRPGPR